MHDSHTWTWSSAANAMSRDARKRLLQHSYEGVPLPLPLLERLCDLEDEEEDMTIPALKQLRASVEDARRFPVDSERFKTVLAGAFSLLSLDEGDIAHVVGVSRSTVLRWKEGNSLPFGAARVPIYDYFLRRISKFEQEGQHTQV
jgi:hypothetical protein